MTRWMLLTLMLVLAIPVQAEIYKWVDANGKIHYSDHPPPPSARSIERKRLADSPADPSLPYVLQEAMKNHPVTLFVYDCGEGCTKAQALLSKRGVPHVTKDPLDPAAREELKKLTGGENVAPVLQVGREVLRGFEERQWNAALDGAGYPATALVKLPARKPAAPPAQPEEQAEPEAAGETPESSEAPETSEASETSEAPVEQ